jgi:hypothetical protein
MDTRSITPEHATGQEAEHTGFPFEGGRHEECGESGARDREKNIPRGQWEVQEREDQEFMDMAVMIRASSALRSSLRKARRDGDLFDT